MTDIAAIAVVDSAPLETMDETPTLAAIVGVGVGDASAAMVATVAVTASAAHEKVDPDEPTVCIDSA